MSHAKLAVKTHSLCESGFGFEPAAFGREGGTLGFGLSSSGDNEKHL